MTINAVPKRMCSSQLPECYTCPIDRVTKSSDGKARWVRCPLVSEKFISYGSCLDLQGLARSEEFYSDSFVDLFENIAEQRGISMGSARVICLRHQSDLLTEMLALPEEDSKEVRLELFRVYSRLADEIRK